MMVTEQSSSPPLLKLKASNPQEMDVLSALVQDSILHKTAFFYDKKQKRAYLLVNRFCWEHALPRDTTGSPGPYYRAHAGLYFHHIEKSEVNVSFREHPADKLLSLLTVYVDNKSDINLIFSEGAHIRLLSKQCCAHLKDLHDGWPTGKKPEHQYD
jgi:hypothetical protein